MCHVSSFI